MPVIKCLFCGAYINTDEEFCSSEHEEAYWKAYDEQDTDENILKVWR